MALHYLHCHGEMAEGVDPLVTRMRQRFDGDEENVGELANQACPMAFLGLSLWKHPSGQSFLEDPGESVVNVYLVRSSWRYDLNDHPEVTREVDQSHHHVLHLFLDRDPRDPLFPLLFLCDYCGLGAHHEVLLETVQGFPSSIVTVSFLAFA